MDTGAAGSTIVPIVQKVPGPRNPSDMMTKNVDQAHIDLYLDLLNLRLGMGRAEIAQNCHSTGEKCSAITSDTAIPILNLHTLFADCLKVLVGELNRLHF